MLNPKEDILFVHIVEQKPNYENATRRINDLLDFTKYHRPAKKQFGIHINKTVKEVKKNRIHTN